MAGPFYAKTKKKKICWLLSFFFPLFFFSQTHTARVLYHFTRDSSYCRAVINLPTPTSSITEPPSSTKEGFLI